MQQALTLARQARGSTSPNPPVGAVVVRNGTVVGVGYTLPPGQRHAEIGALEQAGSSAAGATLYTTLEPCCHHGRTPPCTEAVIAAGIGRVVAGAIDPNPLVSGQGMTALAEAGIDTSLETADEIADLYRAFTKYTVSGLPYVIAKFAMSLDGKIATGTGDSRWVTGSLARAEVQQLRRECDAIMVGINTVLADDPQLTARSPDGSPRAIQPLRVVLDGQYRTPPEARMLQEPGTTLIAATLEASKDRAEALKKAGARIWAAPADADGLVPMEQMLTELGRRGIVSLLVEGGGVTLGTLFDAGLVDQVYAFIAPVIIGGSNAVSPVKGQGSALMAQAWQVADAQMRPIGQDWLVTGYPRKRE